MAKLIEILKGAGRKFATYELGLDELRIFKEGRAEVKELKTRYGLDGNWSLDSYNKWKNDDSVPKQDRNRMEFLLDEILNAGRGLLFKHGISAAEIGLLVYQVSSQQGIENLGVVGTAAIILGIGEYLKGVAHYFHSDEGRMHDLIATSELRKKFPNESSDFARYVRNIFSDQT